MLDELGRDAKDANAVEANELSVAVSVVSFATVVRCAVELDDELVRRDVKVSDVRMERMLTPNANAKLRMAKPPPKQCLAKRRPLAQLASQLRDRKERRGVVGVSCLS